MRKGCSVALTAYGPIAGLRQSQAQQLDPILTQKVLRYAVHVAVSHPVVPVFDVPCGMVICSAHTPCIHLYAP